LLSPPARLLLPWPPRFLARRFQPAWLQGWCFPRLLPLSTQDIQYQYLGALTTTRRRLHRRSPLTFYYTGFRQCSLCDRHHSLNLREGTGLLDIERWILFSCRRAGFISFPGQISQLPAQYKIGGQPSKITKLQVLLGKGFHLQARPDDSHGWSAKYAGDVYKPGFGGCPFFNLSRYRFFSTSSRARSRSVFHGRRLRLDNSSRLLCHLRHKFFYGGGWAAASLSRLAHRFPVVSFPMINGVGWWNLLRELRIQLSA
jgi:hypothetical protein